MTECLPVGSPNSLLVFEDLEGNATQESENAADNGSHNFDPAHAVGQVTHKHAENGAANNGEEYLRPYFAHLWH